jgi:hypothetical protein
VMVAPYAWFSDEAVLLPALLFALYRQMRTGGPLLPFSSVMGVGLLEVFAGANIDSCFYLWTTPAWFALWLMARSGRLTAIQS